MNIILDIYNPNYTTLFEGLSIGTNGIEVVFLTILKSGGGFSCRC